MMIKSQGCKNSRQRQELSSIIVYAYICHFFLGHILSDDQIVHLRRHLSTTPVATFFGLVRQDHLANVIGFLRHVHVGPSYLP